MEGLQGPADSGQVEDCAGGSIPRRPTGCTASSRGPPAAARHRQHAPQDPCAGFHSHHVVGRLRGLRTGAASAHRRAGRRGATPAHLAALRQGRPRWFSPVQRPCLRQRGIIHGTAGAASPCRDPSATCRRAECRGVPLVPRPRQGWTRRGRQQDAKDGQAALCLKEQDGWIFAGGPKVCAGSFEHSIADGLCLGAAPQR
mmetsp:Transcript_90735/g.280621  ORF Transcript_90735/g.280621 Transcript_90735/m.280621 type:complete len:200 (-) Transcript_90735:440-1039(-)